MSTGARLKLEIGLLLLLGLGLLLLASLLAVPASPAHAQAPAGYGIVCTNGPEFHLRAKSGYITIPDGNSLLMWSYANDGTGGAFQLPSPVLCVHQGDVVTVVLTNDLPEATSIIFPGQPDVTSVGSPLYNILGGHEIWPGGTITYSFTAPEPGTYLYESGSSPNKQVQMGLYGALIVRPTLGDNYAYNDPLTQFDREYLLLLHDIDRTLHMAVQRNTTYDVTAMHDDYWNINGRAAPDTDAPNFDPILRDQPYGAMVVIEPGLTGLVRMINAGMVDHPFHPHGNFMEIIGRDGRNLNTAEGNKSINSFTINVGSGETVDFLATWSDAENYSLANPIPVVEPNLQNMGFHLNMTTYSGSPYLGVKGDLPVGILQTNHCGEYYFPWHSHALNEMQNYDEGMGGMFVHFRVDPPGGCMP